MCDFDTVYLFLLLFIFPFHITTIRLSYLNELCLTIPLSLIKVMKVVEGKYVPLYNYLVSTVLF